jgi:thiosulfate/3-mercaptopyruvate sulfurtransferase
MSEGGGASPLVDAAWLLAHRDDADLVVLDARIGPLEDAGGAVRYGSGRASFERDGHIPGARFVDLGSGFSDPAGAFAFTRPSADGLGRAARDLGVNTRSRVVIYDSLSGAWAARAWWVLRAFGHADVRVLDGGLKAWLAAGGALAFGPAAVPPRGDFIPVAKEGFFVDSAEVLAVVEGRKDARLVCASQRAEFTGEAGTSPRRGHIPGSFSSPYRELLDPAGRLNLERVREEVQRIGLERAPEVVLYCGGGVNAAGLALGLVAAGFDPPVIFDGSLNEWRADPALPLETGPERTA